MARFSAVILDATGSILAASPPLVSDHELRCGADSAPREEAAQMLYQRSVRRRQLCQHRQQLSCDGHRRVRLCSSKPLTTCHLPVRLGTWQLIPSLFTLFRPYLAHFPRVFPRFLRVFTVSLSNEPQAGTQGQETAGKPPRGVFDSGPQRLWDESTGIHQSGIGPV